MDPHRRFRLNFHGLTLARPYLWMVGRDLPGRHVRKLAQQFAAGQRAGVEVVESAVAQVRGRRQWEAALALAQVDRQRERWNFAGLIVERDRHPRAVKLSPHGLEDAQ